MKRRFLNVLLASVILAGSGAALTSAVPVHAATPEYYSSYWLKPRKVTVTKKTTLTRYDAKMDTFLKGKKTLKTGKQIILEFDNVTNVWLLNPQNNQRYFWVNRKMNTNWFKLQKNQAIAGFSANTYTAADGSTLKIKAIQRRSVYNAGSNNSRPDEVDLVLFARLTNRSKKQITPKDWLADNLNIYPANKSSMHSLIDDSEGKLLSQDDNFSDLVAARNSVLSKNQNTNFFIILSGNGQDANATSYAFSDKTGHKIVLPVQNIRTSVDVGY